MATKPFKKSIEGRNEMKTQDFLSFEQEKIKEVEK
jgi:hypothetical protein